MSKVVGLIAGGERDLRTSAVKYFHAKRILIDSIIPFPVSEYSFVASNNNIVLKCKTKDVCDMT